MRVALALLFSVVVLGQASSAAAQRRMPRLEARAMRAAGLRLGQAAWVPRPEWRRHRLFHLVHATWPHIFPWVAIARADGRAVVVSGDTHGDPQAAIDAFNAISVDEGISIDDEHEAERYMRFFLTVHLTQGGSYVTSEHIVAILRALDRDDPDRDALVETLGHHDDPIVRDVRREGTHWRAHTYTWRWWADQVNRWEITMDDAGRILALEERDLDPPAPAVP